MERGRGRDPDERRAAAEARARAREGRDETAYEQEEAEFERRSPEGREMSRHYGGPNVYGRRRLFAAAALVALVFVLFLLLSGC